MESDTQEDSTNELRAIHKTLKEIQWTIAGVTGLLFAAFLIKW
jgi:hypothetical protein